MGFDPQALTSLTPPFTSKNIGVSMFRSTGSYEPDPVTATSTFDDTKFRSTGSYEPDPHWDIICKDIKSFDPQALTSLTDFYLYPCHITSVSIHRLLRA